MEGALTLFWEAGGLDVTEVQNEQRKSPARFDQTQEELDAAYARQLEEETRVKSDFRSPVPAYMDQIYEENAIGEFQTPQRTFMRHPSVFDQEEEDLEFFRGHNNAGSESDEAFESISIFPVEH